MGRVEDMVDAVKVEGNFDVDEPRMLRWLSAAHRRMCVRATCIRRRIELGPSVEEQSAYPVPPEVAQILEVLVGGMKYGMGRHSDIAVGQCLLIDGAGVTAEDASEAGGALLSLIPAPSDVGVSIEIFAVCRPPALLAADDSTLGVPEEHDEDLIAGAVAIGLAREAMRPDLAQSFQAQFDAACTELLKSTRRRFRGSGPTQIRVVGYNATA